MKVKRFNNLWAMGLILFGALLIAFYIAKIFFPQFIVGVAEIPSIVKFGEYVDSHKWAYYLFDSIVSFALAYVYCGACCRTYKFNIKQLFILVVWVILLKLSSTFTIEYYSHINYVLMIFAPFICCFIDKKLNKHCFISLCVCFSIDIVTQIMSLIIRDLTILTVQFNSATFYVLILDVFIWRFLLYFYFNYKIKKENKNG